MGMFDSVLERRFDGKQHRCGEGWEGLVEEVFRT
jgi:hypothetical protein